MRYAQVEGGQQLHLVFEAGEGFDSDSLVPAGCVSKPLCNRPWNGHYRMTINAPLGHACKNCLRVWESRSPQAAMPSLQIRINVGG
jgi:hypothetical protein